MTRYLKDASKLSQILAVTLFLFSTFFFVSTANARQGCSTGYHPNPYNPAQCVANGTTGVEGKCRAGQHRWFDPRSNRWYRCN